MRTLSRYLPHFAVDGVPPPSGPEAPAQRAHPGAERTGHAPPPKPQAPTFSQEEVSLAVSQAVREASAKLKADLFASETRRREDAEAFEATLNDRLAIARAEWTEAEGDRLAAAIGDSFAALEGRISDTLARILTPFVSAAMRERAIEDARRAIAGLLNQPLAPESAAPTITVRGPEDLLAALKERLGEPEGMSFCPSTEVELEVTSSDTLIETRLGAWARLLVAAQDEVTEEGSVAHGG